MIRRKPLPFSCDIRPLSETATHLIDEFVAATPDIYSVSLQGCGSAHLIPTSDAFYNNWVDSLVDIPLTIGHIVRGRSCILH